MGTDFNFSFLLTGIVGGVRRTMLASLGWGGIMLAMQMCLVWLEVGKQSLLCLKPFWTAKVPQNTSVKKRKTVFSLFRLKLEVTLDSLGERTKCRHHWNRFPISQDKTTITNGSPVSSRSFIYFTVPVMLLAGYRTTFFFLFKDNKQ